MSHVIKLDGLLNCRDFLNKKKKKKFAHIFHLIYQKQMIINWCLIHSFTFLSFRFCLFFYIVSLFYSLPTKHFY